MSSAYWNQWSFSEIMSMHGVDVDQESEDNENDDCDSSEHIEDRMFCPSCSGSGCNYCLGCTY